MTLPSLEPSQSLPAEREVMAQTIQHLLDTTAPTGPTGLLMIHLDAIDAVTIPVDDPGDLGERLLKAAYNRVTSLLKGPDRTLRVGLDEIAVIRAGMQAPAEAEGLALHLSEALKKPFELDAISATCPFAIGVAATLQGDDARDLIRFAEHALSNAVVLGRNQMVAFDDADRELLAAD